MPAVGPTGPIHPTDSAWAAWTAPVGRRFAYIVHDVEDPAVHRRIAMLQAGGAEVRLLGFRRAAAAPRSDPATRGVIGHTADGRMGQRVRAVLVAWLRRGHWRSAFDGADLVIARQLETLVLAAATPQCRTGAVRLGYECLDIHRLMLGHGPTTRALRALEGRLLRRCQVLIVSSAAFVRAYFKPVHRWLPPVELVENRVLSAELADQAGCTVDPALPAGPPWRIGWFGVIRCRRSLDLLAALVRSRPGQVEVCIRGRIAHAVLPDFAAVVAATDGITFGGPYDRRRDLAQMYGEQHLVWAIDGYEAGGNSEWLLPNRLYEGGAFGAVPIALASVETGRWLADRGAGLLLDEPLDRTLPALVDGLNRAGLHAARLRMRAVPTADFICDSNDCVSLAARLGFAPKSSVAAPHRDRGDRRAVAG